jgi:hypothetical protein
MKYYLLSLLMTCSLTATAQDSIDPNVQSSKNSQVGLNGQVANKEDEVNIGRAEKMFGFLLDNKADSLYENLSAQVKPMVQKQQFEGILNKVEPQVGKYQKHGEWEVQQVMGQKCYVSMVQFEKTELGALVIFDAAGKMLGIQLVPAAAVKKE